MFFWKNIFLNLLEKKYCYCKIKYYTEGKHCLFLKKTITLFSDKDNADTYIQQVNVTARFPLMSSWEVILSDKLSVLMHIYHPIIYIY